MPTSRPGAARRNAVKVQAWEAIVWFAAFAQVLIGLAMLQGGRHSFDSPVFNDSALVPWFVWGAVALLVGVLMPWVGLLRDIALTISVLWYGLWWGLLTSGLLRAPGHVALYPVAVYGFLTALHIMLWAVEFISANPWVDKGSREQ